MNVVATVAIFAPPVIALGYVAGQALRRKTALGGRYLLYFMGSSLLWLTGYALQLNVTTTQWNMLLAQIEFLGVTTSPVFFFLFAVRYTQGPSLTKWQERGLFVVPILTLVLVWTNPVNQLMWSDYNLRFWYGLVLTERQFGPWYFVHSIFSYLTFLAGVLLFVVLLAGRNFLFRRQAVAILIGTIIPVTLTAPYVLGLSPVDGFDLTPFAFAIMGLAFGYAFVDTEFYDVVPAIKTVGWANVANEIDSGIIVTDTETNIVEANRTVCRMFDIDREDAIGHPITALFDTDETITEVASGYELVRGDNTVFQIQASSIWDGRNDRFGFTFTVVDVTERRRRSQQLQVLNRVLRHNLRNKAMVITGNAEQIEAVADDAERDTKLDRIDDLASAITDAGERLGEMSDTAGQVDGIIQESGVEVQEIGRVVDASLAAVRRKYGNVAVQTNIDGDPKALASDRLEQALTHLVRNAYEHNPNDTTIEIHVHTVNDVVDITVSDDGNGIPEHELEPLKIGTETPLEHGSGLGLWFVRWTVAASDGTIEIETGNGDGTAITLSLPRADADE